LSNEFKIIRDALKVLELPILVTFEDIKKQYYKLSKKHHPDINKEDSKMANINDAYAVLKQYVFNYRFSFSDEEIAKQFPEESHADKFRF
jgi:DnaJ-class molecular chaperone